MSLIKEIIKSVRESLENTTIHAIPNILKAKNKILKSIWVFFLLNSASICYYFIQDNLKYDFFSYDTLFKVETKYPLDKIEFPTVGICNLNKWDDINTNEVILKCSFGSNNCSSKFLTKYIDTEYGTCIRINAGDNMDEKQIKYVYNSGFRHSLSLEMFFDSNKTETWSEKGLILFINSENIDSSFQSGIKLPTGFSTDIVLNKQTKKSQPFPYSLCTHNLNNIESECFKRTLILYKRYKYAFCENLCLQKIIGDFCNIQIINIGAIYYNDKKNVTYNDEEALNCTIQRKNLFQDSYKYLLECGCPIECEYSSFKYHYSMSNYPTSSYAKKLINESSYLNSLYPNFSEYNNYNEFKNNILAFKIYYDEMKEIITSDVKKTNLYEIIANIGGTIGFFLGLSLLSLVEFLEILINIVIITFKYCFNRKSKLNTTN
jgi:hypothetical protein